MNNGWMDIGSPPDSMEDVLTWGPWGRTVGAFIGGKWVTGFEEIFECAGTEHDFKPTHWQPLPKGPKE